MKLNTHPQNVKRGIYISNVVIFAYLSQAALSPELTRMFQGIIQLALWGSFGLSTKFLVQIILSEECWLRRLLLGTHNIYGFWIDTVKDKSSKVIFVCVNEIAFVNKYPYIICKSSRYDLNGRFVENVILSEWKLVDIGKYDVEKGKITFSSRGDYANKFSLSYDLDENLSACQGFKITNSYDITQLKSEKFSKDCEAVLVKKFIAEIKSNCDI